MKDPLFGNKVAGALLAAALIMVGIPVLSKTFGGHHGGHHSEGWPFPHYPEIDLGVSGGAAEAVPVDLGTLMAAADPARGARRSALCKSCHTFEEGGAQGTGPNLYDIVGRAVAGVPGFNYSGALTEFGGTWTYERLDEYLKNSQSYVPGTAMVQRFPKDEQRAELLAYLGSLSPSPLPFPEPAAPAPEAESDAEEEHASDDAH